MSDIKDYDKNIQEKLNYENLIQKCYKSKRRLYEQLLLKEISLEEYNELKSEYDNKLNNLKSSLADISLKTELLKKKKEKETTLHNISDVISNESTLNKTLSDLLIDKVFVYPNNRVEIAWKVQEFS